jgi:DNA-directed RNA polymerase subunit RPC12/RpoP
MVEAKTVTAAVRCPCGSAVFYDWGLQMLHSTPTPSVRGGNVERFNDWVQGSNVKICARCNTPYIIEAGTLVDVSDELGPEEIKSIIARGQATLPHPNVKDP